METQATIKQAGLGAIVGKLGAGTVRLLKSRVAGELARRGAGATLGGLHGYYVSPNILDYKDIPAARRSSTLIDALMGAVVAGKTPSVLKGMGAVQRDKMLAKGVGIYGAGQIAPVIQANLAEGRKTSRLTADAARANAESSKITSIPYNLKQFAGSNLGKGLVGGAAVGGLGGIIGGLMRRRTHKEEQEQASRGSMIGKDILKYILPAMAAGGVVGSLKNKLD